MSPLVVPVFVDALRFTRARSKNPKTVYCHLISTDLTALHALAEQLGISRAQYDGKITPHYALSAVQRTKAVAAGAVEASRREVMGITKFWKKEKVHEGATNNATGV
jgi:hypothetical protein